MENRVHLTLRIASAMCFIGHGVFGILTKAIWCNYFALLGIGHDLAYQLMPWLGSVDVILGFSLLVYPLRPVLAWLVVWGFITASMRPLSGEPFAELIERAGNFGAPLALLLFSGLDFPLRSGSRQWLRPVTAPVTVSDATLRRTTLCLRIIVFLLLAGHGWLNLLGKSSILSQYASLGFSDPMLVAQCVGGFECCAALAVLLRPLRPLLLVLFCWKAGTELFYPHHELFEWIERGGSYGTLLALWFLSGHASPVILDKKKTFSSL